MELAEAGRIVAAFLSGGVGGALLQHVLADRAARRAALRPKDMERINSVRKAIHIITDAITTNCKQPKPDNYARLQDQTHATVLELSDRKLHRLWASYVNQAVLYDLHHADANNAEASAIRLDSTRSELLKRLNRLERRR